jgi:hypothetical protein
MAWQPHIKIPIDLLDSGDLPRGTRDDYIDLSRLAMTLRKRRSGDTFIAARSAISRALGVNTWANARRRLEKLASLTPLVQWREVDETKVEITLVGFEDRQGFGRRRGPERGQREVEGGPTQRPGRGQAAGQAPARSRNSSSSVENLRRLQNPDTRSQNPEGGSLRSPGGREGGIAFPGTLPRSVRDYVQARRSQLHANVHPLVDDDSYLEEEWHRFTEYHRGKNTQAHSFEKLFMNWLKNAFTGEHAHEWRKRSTEAIARGL